jgi:Transposase DDE domain
VTFPSTDGISAHHVAVQALLQQPQTPPEEDASPKVKMQYKLQTEIGKEIYRLRKCTVEPVFGIIKETMGFRQFSLRGLTKAAGEWSLVCFAFNLRRLQTLTLKKTTSPTGC